MSTEYDLLEGLDPSPLGVISASQLLQMIRQAEPRDTRGLFIYQNTEPDVINNPKYKRFGWIKPSESPKRVRFYDEGTNLWKVQPVEAAIITGDNILDLTIPLGKLIPGPASYLLRTNLAGTVAEWFPFSLDDNSVDLIKIVKSNIGGYLLRTSLDGSQNEWFKLNPLDYIDFGGIGLAFLEQGGARKILRMDATGENLVYEDFPSLEILDHSLPLSKLVSGLADQIPIVNPGATSLEYKTIYFEQTDAVNLSGRLGAQLEFMHGLGATPTRVEFRLICIVDDPSTAYTAGQEINVDQVERNSSTESCFTIYCDTNIIGCQALTVNDFFVREKGDGQRKQLTSDNWRLKGIAERLKFT